MLPPPPPPPPPRSPREYPYPEPLTDDTDAAEEPPLRSQGDEEELRDAMEGEARRGE